MALAVVPQEDTHAVLRAWWVGGMRTADQQFDEAAAQAEFAALDRLALTVWMSGVKKAPSGHVGGGMMRNSDWLKAEQASFARSGITVEIAENPLKKGEFALVRAVVTLGE